MKCDGEKDRRPETFQRLGETLGWIDAEKSHALVSGIDNHSMGLIKGIANLQEAMNGEIRLQP
jgi:hypothetical protein